MTKNNLSNGKDKCLSMEGLSAGFNSEIRKKSQKESKMNIFRLSREVFYSRESILNWCRENNLLPHPDSVICPLCGCQAVFEDRDGYVAGRFRCTKRIERHVDPKKKSTRVYFDMSGAKNTFFSGAKMGIPKILVLTYCWVNEYNYRQTTDICHSILENEEERLSSETIADWFSYLKRSFCIRSRKNLY